MNGKTNKDKPEATISRYIACLPTEFRSSFHRDIDSTIFE